MQRITHLPTPHPTRYVPSLALFALRARCGCVEPPEPRTSSGEEAQTAALGSCSAARRPETAMPPKKPESDRARRAAWS
eukprot:4079826-Prymnesium_polylepis.1